MSPRRTLLSCLFVRSLVGGKSHRAELVTQPAVLEKALPWAGLASSAKLAHFAPRSHSGTRWPRSPALRVRPARKIRLGARGALREQQGHWLIDDIVTLASEGAEADTTIGGHDASARACTGAHARAQEHDHAAQGAKRAGGR